MQFPTVAFAAFFLVAFVVNWFLRPRYGLWVLALSLLSFWFYAYDPKPGDDQDFRVYVFLLLASVVGNWVLGQFARRSRWVVRGAVAANLGVLAFFKYHNFLRDQIHLPIPGQSILLPIAISFFTFHAISYVIDIGRGDTEPLRLDEFALYMSFFPHLVSGPIVRASEFGPQLRAPADPRSIPFGEATRLILRGLFKKVVISSFLHAAIVDPAFGAPGQHGSLELLVAVYAYAVNIYCDFSGYTDIAIGCALLLGIRFPQNFDAPYRALSLQDFWRRWHMTLSRWLRDYLYIPLGGNRKGEGRTYLNLFLTMLIGGFWHGAAWVFLIWGAIHGGFLALERWLREWWRAGHPEPVLPRALSAPLQWLVTFHVVCFAWIFFAAGTEAEGRLDVAWEVIGGIAAGAGSAELVTVGLVLLVAVAIAVHFVPPRAGVAFQRGFARWPTLAQGIAIAAALTVIDILGPDGVPDFIYSQF